MVDLPSIPSFAAFFVNMNYTHHDERPAPPERRVDRTHYPVADVANIEANLWAFWAPLAGRGKAIRHYRSTQADQS
jgi:hypothetical protein